MPSTATVKTIHLTKDEKAPASKGDLAKKLLARKAAIANAEANALAFEEAFAKLRAINQQGATLYQSFKEIAEAIRKSLQIVREFFAHKKKGNSSITNLRQAMHGQQKDVALGMATFAGA